MAAHRTPHPRSILAKRRLGWDRQGVRPPCSSCSPWVALDTSPIPITPRIKQGKCFSVLLPPVGVPVAPSRATPPGPSADAPRIWAKKSRNQPYSPAKPYYLGCKTQTKRLSHPHLTAVPLLVGGKGCLCHGKPQHNVTPMAKPSPQLVPLLPWSIFG